MDASFEKIPFQPQKMPKPRLVHGKVEVVN